MERHILSESYTQRPNAIPEYFTAILGAQAPERFSTKFMENLGFTSTNDRLFIAVLKDLGFLNRDGAPQTRYFEFLDRSKSQSVVAAAIKEAFSDLFAVNIRANELTVDEVKNKLRTLYAGKKTELTIDRIARTFKALTEYADFASMETSVTLPPPVPKPVPEAAGKAPDQDAGKTGSESTQAPPGKIVVSGLQYHMNIVLPDTRDQAVYDAIFKSLREHLG